MIKWRNFWKKLYLKSYPKSMYVDIIWLETANKMQMLAYILILFRSWKNDMNWASSFLFSTGNQSCQYKYAWTICRCTKQRDNIQNMANTHNKTSIWTQQFAINYELESIINFLLTLWKCYKDYFYFVRTVIVQNRKKKIKKEMKNQIKYKYFQLLSEIFKNITKELASIILTKISFSISKVLFGIWDSTWKTSL